MSLEERSNFTDDEWMDWANDTIAVDDWLFEDDPVNPMADDPLTWSLGPVTVEYDSSARMLAASTALALATQVFL